jgi:hypothetical protein
LLADALDIALQILSALAASGWRGYLRKKIDLAEEQAKQGYINRFMVAQDYALLGDTQQSILRKPILQT